jgi:hypothetical protein
MVSGKIRELIEPARRSSVSEPAFEPGSHPVATHHD